MQHGLQHVARHKTTWTGHRKNKTTGTVVPICNQIDYILCKQIHRQLLTGARLYNGGHTTSDHRILVAKFKLDRVFETFSTSKQSTKLKRFAVGRLSGPNNVREAYRESISDELARVNMSSPQTTWDSVLKILKMAVKKTIGLRPKQVKNNGIFDPVIDHISREQKDLRLRIENTKNEMTCGELRKRRNKIIHEMRKRTFEKASSFLDEGAKEIARLQYGPQMFKAVHLLQRRQHSKLTMHDEFNNVIADKYKVSSIIVKQSKTENGNRKPISRWNRTRR